MNLHTCLIIGGSESIQSVVGGGILGLGAGALAGWGLYAGVVRIPVRWFFSATSALVLLLSAAMASNMARFLVAADVLPTLADPMWDSSSFLDQSSPMGILLHLLMGYEAQPLGIQVVAYTMTLTLILLGMWYFRIKPQVRQITGKFASSPAAG